MNLVLVVAMNIFVCLSRAQRPVNDHCAGKDNGTVIGRSVLVARPKGGEAQECKRSNVVAHAGANAQVVDFLGNLGEADRSHDLWARPIHAFHVSGKGGRIFFFLLLCYCARQMPSVKESVGAEVVVTNGGLVR